MQKSNKITEANKLKKTFWFNGQAQEKMAELMEHFGYKTEASVIEEMLYSHLKLIAEKKQLQLQLQEMKKFY